MTFFYDLNKRLADLGKQQEQISESVEKAAAKKSPTQQTLEQALRTDLKSLMEDASAGLAQGNTLEEKAGYSAKKAAAGKDIGKPGKNFAKIAKSAGKEYGSKEAGERVAGAVLNKLRTKESTGEKADKDYDKDGKIESPKAEYMGARIAAGKKAAKKMKEQISSDSMDEAGLPDVADKAKKMSIARGEKSSPLKNVGKGLKAFFKGEPEPMDEEAEMMEFLRSKLGHAEPHAYNKGTGKPDAHNGMQFEEEGLEEAVSRKHFQQVADLLKNIPDEAKRKEMAMHHASIFKQQNPRFDIVRFGQAAGVDLTECGMWEDLKGGQHKLDVDGDGDIGADDLADLRAGNEVDEGFGEMDAWLKQREKEKGTGKFDSRKVSTGTVYTRKPETFGDEESEVSADAPKRGRGRPASTKPVEKRVTKGAYKHKQTAEGEEEVDEEKQEAGKRHFFDKLAPAAKKVAKVVGAVTKGKKEVDEESTAKKDTKAEKAGKKVAKDIEHDEGNKSKGDNKAEKAGKKVTKDIEFDDKKDKKEKEEKVDETTTSGSVATAMPKASKGAGQVGKGIYDSWDRQYQSLLAESINVAQSSTKMEDGNEEESITIDVTGDDVARFKEVLASMGLGQQGPADAVAEPEYADSCGTCGGVPCQCDELGAEVMGLPGAVEFEVVDEADAPVSQNSPDYPTNQEYDDDALQYAGGLNGPKSTGQSTVPVLASQKERQVAEDVDSFLSLYKAFKTK